MSGFEHYERELAELDHEIRRYAAICGVNLANRYEIDACVSAHHDSWQDDKARESLKGLLILRIKLEAEMIELGFSPPSLIPPAPVVD
ncbi:MAG: hypothetical protein D3M94_15385 [Rhodocyclales bacterium GT-UBC]|nr:MAG: hypothetical protein D3M94_15385 [Rhodocyclales bacterium GT-UBC]